VAALILAVGIAQPSYAAMPAHLAEPSPTTKSSRAGSLPGVGRERPGRGGVDSETSEVEPDDPAETGTRTGTGTETGTDPTASEPDRPTGNTYDTAPYGRDEPDTDTVARPGPGQGTMLRALPLGGGLILIGLGLGVAFVALRVRR
jgi:hypothetical protein